jgi:GntR family transcriptional regulator
VIDDGRPIFEQVADLIERQILDGSLAEEAQAPSTNELASFHRINPATAAKGLSLLVTEQILYKKRGIGMFVSTGARDKLLARRREEFRHQFVEPLLAQAERLGFDEDNLVVMIREGRRS